MHKELKEIMKEDMEKLPFVIWDRFWERDNGATVFGWVDREDSYKDFVYMDYDYDSKTSKKNRINTWDMGYGTSSARYSKEIHRTLMCSDDHSDCQRVENHFDIQNVVTL